MDASLGVSSQRSLIEKPCGLAQQKAKQMGPSRQQDPRRFTLFTAAPSYSLQAWGLMEVTGDPHPPPRTPEQLAFGSALPFRPVEAALAS